MSEAVKRSPLSCKRANIKSLLLGAHEACEPLPNDLRLEPSTSQTNKPLLTIWNAIFLPSGDKVGLSTILPANFSSDGINFVASAGWSTMILRRFVAFITFD